MRLIRVYNTALQLVEIFKIERSPSNDNCAYTKSDDVCIVNSCDNELLRVTILGPKLKLFEDELNSSNFWSF